MVSSLLVGVSLLACAALSVPLYRRIRRHPQFDEIQAANKKLEYTRRLFKAFLDETPFAVYVLNHNHHFLYVNGRVCQDLNIAWDELEKMSPFAWLGDEAARRIIAHCARVRETGTRSEFVLELAREGASCAFLYSVFPLPGPQGESLIGVVAIEISDELLSKETDSLLASIVELSPNAIYTLSDTGLVTSWNKGAEQILGYQATRSSGNRPHFWRATGATDRSPNTSAAWNQAMSSSIAGLSTSPRMGRANALRCRPRKSSHSSASAPAMPSSVMTKPRRESPQQK